MSWAPVAEGSPSLHPSALCPSTRPQPQVKQGQGNHRPKSCQVGGASRQAAGTELRLQWVLGVGPRRRRPGGVCSPAALGCHSSSAKWGCSRLPCLPSCRADCCGRGLRDWKVPGGRSEALWPGSALGRQRPTSGPTGWGSSSTFPAGKAQAWRLGSRTEPQVWRPGS